ncbi:hypothetical protein K8R47_02805 [archaeon]|nr:hypothetical protein [archaeon]
MKYKPKLPNKFNDEFAYFCGLILGDGSLPLAKSKRPNGKYQKRHIIHFYCNSLNFIEKVYYPLFKKLFEVSPRIISIKRPKKNIMYNCSIESKEIYNFLNEKGLTLGKKAKIGKIPKIPKKYYPSLLAGLLDTNGGKKGNGFGLSTASNDFANFCVKIFKKFNMSHHSCPWNYKDYIYHQIYVHKKDFHKILKHIPLKNIEKIKYLNASVA